LWFASPLNHHLLSFLAWASLGLARPPWLRGLAAPQRLFVATTPAALTRPPSRRDALALDSSTLPSHTLFHSFLRLVWVRRLSHLLAVRSRILRFVLVRLHHSPETTPLVVAYLDCRPHISLPLPMAVVPDFRIVVDRGSVRRFIRSTRRDLTALHLAPLCWCPSIGLQHCRQGLLQPSLFSALHARLSAPGPPNSQALFRRRSHAPQSLVSLRGSTPRTPASNTVFTNTRQPVKGSCCLSRDAIGASDCLLAPPAVPHLRLCSLGSAALRSTLRRCISMPLRPCVLLELEVTFQRCLPLCFA